MAEAKPRILFLCTGNSCRSQMALGWARAQRGDRWTACSAGTAPGKLNPLAVRAMAEAGVDITHYMPMNVRALAGQPFDLVVTVCDSAKETCPVLPGAARTIHKPFDDPPYLARDAATEDDAMPHYRRVRDEIRAFIEQLNPATSL